MSLSWVGAGTLVFYNLSSANEWVLATIMGPSQRPGDYLLIQYEVNGKAVIHDATALHRLKFHIRSPSPSLSTSSKLEPDGQDAPQDLDERHASMDGEDTPPPPNLMNKFIFLMVRTPPPNLRNNMLLWMVKMPPPPPQTTC